MISPVDRVTLVRTIGLVVPLGSALLLLQWFPTTARDRGAILLATLWNVVTLLALQPLAHHLSWWSFGVRGGTLAGTPVDLLVGWSVLWGCVVPLVGRDWKISLRTLIVLLLDLTLMPACMPAVQLGHSWLVGELVMLAVAFVPSQLLLRWTREESHLPRRALMQAVIFSSLMMGVLPAIILQLEGGGPQLSSKTGLALQMLPLTALVGLAAVQEFAARGGGTPFPYDPPKRLVTSGPYAYVRNPMQLSMTVTLLVWGAALNSRWVACAAVGSLAYAAGLAHWSEHADLDRRFGIAWSAYASRVPSWIPRWRPSTTGLAHIYVSDTCGQCRQVGGWLRRRHVTGVEIVAAEEHPRRLVRITYEAPDGHEEEGVAAVARVLEHIHFGWALVGFSMRLPVVRPILQLIADAVGGGPRAIPIRSTR